MRGNSDKKHDLSQQDKQPHNENEGHEITGHLTIHIDHCLTKNNGTRQTLEFATTQNKSQTWEYHTTQLNVACH